MKAFFNFFLVFIIFYDCASEKPFIKEKFEGGVIVIENHLDEDIEVFANGERIGVIPSKRSERFISLPLKENNFYAIGMKTKKEKWAKFILEEKKEKKWIIEETLKEKEKKATGTINVVNHSGEPIKIKIDGVECEMVYKGSENNYHDLEEGVHKIEAKGMETGFISSISINVKKNAISIWHVLPPKATLLIKNKTFDKMTIYISGLPYEIKPQGEIILTDIPIGEQKIYAIGEKGKGKMEKDVQIEGGKMNEIILSPPSATLAVLNSLKETIEIFYEGRLLGAVPQDGATQFEGLLAGQCDLLALNKDGLILEKYSTQLTEDAVTLWIVKGGYFHKKFANMPSLLIKNRSGENIDVKIDGILYSRIKNDEKKILPNIKEGAHLIEGLGEKTLTIYSIKLAFGGREQIEWNIEPPLGVLRLNNLNNEDIKVYVDGNLETLIPKNHIDWMEIKIPSGKREIEARGVETLQSKRFQINIKPQGIYEFSIPFKLSTIVVENDYDEVLLIKIDLTELGEILPKEKKIFENIESGEHTLTASSIKNPVKWIREIFLREGEKFLWKLKK